MAVLAFENRSRDSADVYLTEGFQDEVSNRLGQIPRLTVISPGVVRRLPRAAEMPLEQVGPALRARHLVLGSFQRARDRLRVSVQLVRANDGVQLWAQSYDTQGDALEVQSDVALRVATAILARLLPGESQALEARQTRNPVAWDHYQRANHAMARRTIRTLDSAILNYEAALAADSTLIQARARIPYAMALMRFLGGAVRSHRGDTLVALALRAADDAIRRDSSSSDAWMAKGYLMTFRNPATYDGAREAFERSLQLDPRNAEAAHQYAATLAELRYDEAALRLYRRAIEIEPGRAITYRDRAWLRFLRGEIAIAKADSDSGLAIDSAPHGVHQRIQAGARDTLMLQRMVREIERRGGNPTTVRYYLRLLAGDTAGVRSALTQEGNWYYALVGVIDTVVARMQRITPNVRSWGTYFAPEYARIRADPRFLEAWRRLRPPTANPAVREQP